MRNTIFLICISIILFFQISTACCCKKNLKNNISRLWIYDSLGHENIRIVLYHQVIDCKKYLIGKKIDDIVKILGNYNKINTYEGDNYKYVRYNILEDKNNIQGLPIAFFVFKINKKNKIIGLRLSGQDG